MSYFKLILIILTIVNFKTVYAYNSNHPDTQSLIIHDLDDYRASNSNGFYYKNKHSDKTILHIRLAGESYLKNRYKIVIQCSGPFQQDKLLGPAKAKKKKQSYKLTSTIYPDKDLANFKLEINQKTGDCAVDIKDHFTPVSFFIKPEAKYIAKLNLPRASKTTVCNNSSLEKRSTNAQKFFHQLSGKYTSCSKVVDGIKNLTDGYTAFQEKTKVLLGQKISHSTLTAIDKGIYNLDLIDFSKAPKLDGIFISALTFINDLSGKIILKLLEHHAQRGTQIRVIVSNKVGKSKVNLALRHFKSKYHNVQIKFLTINDHSDVDPLKEFINKTHRVNHIKIFATYSETEPINNHAILGGRNLSDIYFFTDLPKGNNKIHYSDFEYKISSTKFIHSLIDQYLDFWVHYNPSFYVSSSHRHNFSTGLPSTYYDQNKIYIKNQISYPTIDQKALESNFVQLFDSANETITIVTPYLNLTAKISQSIFNAIQRGVNIKIVTNLNLNKDSFGGVLSAINGDSANKLFRNISLYEYTKKDHLLHAKIILIDNELTVLGSVNLNKRSFFHDTENISYILSQNYQNRVYKISKNYFFDESNLIDSKLKPNKFYKFIISLIPDVF